MRLLRRKSHTNHSQAPSSVLTMTGPFGLWGIERLFRQTWDKKHGLSNRHGENRQGGWETRRHGDMEYLSYSCLPVFMSLCPSGSLSSLACDILRYKPFFTHA